MSPQRGPALIEAEDAANALKDKKKRKKKKKRNSDSGVPPYKKFYVVKTLNDGTNYEKVRRMEGFDVLIVTPDDCRRDGYQYDKGPGNTKLRMLVQMSLDNYDKLVASQQQSDTAYGSTSEQEEQDQENRMAMAQTVYTTICDDWKGLFLTKAKRDDPKRWLPVDTSEAEEEICRVIEECAKARKEDRRKAREAQKKAAKEKRNEEPKKPKKKRKLEEEKPVKEKDQEQDQDPSQDQDQSKEQDVDRTSQQPAGPSQAQPQAQAQETASIEKPATDTAPTEQAKPQQQPPPQKEPTVHTAPPTKSKAKLQRKHPPPLLPKQQTTVKATPFMAKKQKSASGDAAAPIDAAPTNAPPQAAATPGLTLGTDDIVGTAATPGTALARMIAANTPGTTLQFSDTGTPQLPPLPAGLSPWMQRNNDGATEKNDAFVPEAMSPALPPLDQAQGPHAPAVPNAPMPPLTAEEAQTANNKVATNDNDNDNPVKRKRGRPRKGEVRDPPPPRRKKRGRPPKNETLRRQQEQEQQQQQQEEYPQQPQLKRRIVLPGPRDAPTMAPLPASPGLLHGNGLISPGGKNDTWFDFEVEETEEQQTSDQEEEKQQSSTPKKLIQPKKAGSPFPLPPPEYEERNNTTLTKARALLKVKDPDWIEVYDKLCHTRVNLYCNGNVSKWPTGNLRYTAKKSNRSTDIALNQWILEQQAMYRNFCAWQEREYWRQQQPHQTQGMAVYMHSQHYDRMHGQTPGGIMATDLNTVLALKTAAFLEATRREQAAAAAAAFARVNTLATLPNLTSNANNTSVAGATEKTDKEKGDKEGASTETSQSTNTRETSEKSKGASKSNISKDDPSKSKATKTNTRNHVAKNTRASIATSQTAKAMPAGKDANNASDNSVDKVEEADQSNSPETKKKKKPTKNPRVAAGEDASNSQTDKAAVCEKQATTGTTKAADNKEDRTETDADNHDDYDRKKESNGAATSAGEEESDIAATKARAEAEVEAARARAEAAEAEAKKMDKEFRKLQSGKIVLLDAIHFVWQPDQEPPPNASEEWKESFLDLREYLRSRGDTAVPDTVELGVWAQLQRMRYQRSLALMSEPSSLPGVNERKYATAPPLTREQIIALRGLGFDWENLDSSRFYVMYMKLLEFKNRVGDCLVPPPNLDSLYPEDDDDKEDDEGDNQAEDCMVDDHADPQLFFWVQRVRFEYIKFQEARAAEEKRVATRAATNAMDEDGHAVVEQLLAEEEKAAELASKEKRKEANTEDATDEGTVVGHLVQSPPMSTKKISETEDTANDASEKENEGANGASRPPARAKKPKGRPRKNVDQTLSSDTVSTLTQDQIDLLNAAGFIWSTDITDRWIKQYRRLQAFYIKNG